MSLSDGVAILRLIIAQFRPPFPHHQNEWAVKAEERKHVESSRDRAKVLGQDLDGIVAMGCESSDPSNAYDRMSSYLKPLLMHENHDL